MSYIFRQKKLQNFLKKKGISAFLVLGTQDIFYLSGFYGSLAYLLVTKHNIFLLVDGRYYEQAKNTVKGVEIILFQDPFKVLKKILTDSMISSVFFDSIEMTVAFLDRLNHKIANVNFYPVNKSPIKLWRMIKEEEEIKLLKEGASKSKDIFDSLTKNVKVGFTEKEIAAQLNFMIEQNTEGVSFDTIVLTGSNTSLPHGLPTLKKVKKNDVLLIDFGIKWQHYCTDHTRMLFFGKNEMEKYLKIVKNAMQKAFENIKDGVFVADVDLAVRNYFESKNLLQYFVHSSGHGIGLNVHERPLVSYKSKERLKTGMVITIEPGLYFPNIGGVRYEEMVLVKERGFELL